MSLIPTHSKWENVIVDLCRQCKHIMVFESKQVVKQNLSPSILSHIPEGYKTIGVQQAICPTCGNKQSNSIRSALAYRFECPTCGKLIIVPREPVDIVREGRQLIHRYSHDDICCDCGEILRAAFVGGEQILTVVVPEPRNFFHFPYTTILLLLLLVIWSVTTLYLLLE